MSRGRPKEFDRDQALEKAMMVFWERGYGAAGMSELTHRMGIGRQSLYDTFGDKRRLFLAALEHYSNDQMLEVERMLSMGESPIENIGRMFDYWRQTALDDELCDGCMLANSLAEFGGSDPEIEDILRRKMTRLERAFLRALEQAEAAGELRPGAQPRALARFLVSVGQGISLQSKLGLDAEQVDDILATVEAALH